MHSPTLIFGVVLPGALLLSGCSGLAELSEGGVEMAQTPITDHPTGETHPGRFVWHDLLTPDIRAAGAFYQKLFGWDIEYGRDYAVVRNRGKLIAGMLQLERADGDPRDGVWIPSVSVSDVDTAASLAEAHGGTILKGPVDMKRRGRAALVSDPQRADLVFLRATDGDPPAAESAVGDWLWDEIWTHAPDSTEEFYAAVVGYDQMLPGDGYAVFVRDGEWRAGVRQVARDSNHLLWVPVVRVADPEATAQRVTALGGVVWVSPEEAPGTGDTALIGDPTGALLLIQRWPSSASEGRL